MIPDAGAADSAARVAAAASALGPIGAGYLAAYVPAQGNNLSATLELSAYTRRWCADGGAEKSFVAADSV